MSTPLKRSFTQEATPVAAPVAAPLKRSFTQEATPVVTKRARVEATPAVPSTAPEGLSSEIYEIIEVTSEGPTKDFYKLFFEDFFSENPKPEHEMTAQERCFLEFFFSENPKLKQSLFAKRAPRATDHIFPQSLSEEENVLLGLLDKHSGKFYEFFLEDLCHDDEDDIASVVNSKKCRGAFKTIYDKGLDDFNENALDEVTKQYDLSLVDATFIASVLTGLANNVNEAVTKDLGELVDEDDKGLFNFANINLDDVKALSDRLYYSKCCAWAANPDWSNMNDGSKKLHGN